MANKFEVWEAVSREYESFKTAKLVYCYNTGYAGKGVGSTETASSQDLESAAKDLKGRVENDGLKANVRTAKSYSGTAVNEWSILIEKWGSSQPSFNFHMAIR